MSSIFHVLYIRIMKCVYTVRDTLPPDVVRFGRQLLGRTKAWKSAFRGRIAACVPALIRGFWYRRDWWKAICLKKFFPEEWLYERDYQRRYKKWEQRLYRRLVEANVKLGRSLTEEETKKLQEFESRYTSIRLWFMDSHATIAGLCFGYAFFAEDSKNDEGHVCRVLYRDGEFDSSYISPNTYLSDKFYESFDSITKENFAFWYAYLMRNRDKIIIETIESHLKREYVEMRKFYDTGQVISHNGELTFSKEEERTGEDRMKRLGISEPFICIFARDARYNHEERHISTLEIDSQNLRNSDINTFKPMTVYFGAQNIQSVRMGAVAATKYECEYAVDYANAGRTEFLDAFLFSRCKFFIGDNSGIFGLTLLAGTPYVAVNLHVPIWFGDQTVWPVVGIYLKYYDKKARRFLRLREIVSLQIWYHASVQEPNDGGYDVYIRKHYHIVRNTPEEILDVAKEMEAIQNHTIQYTEHDEQLQKRYRFIINSFLSMYPTVISPFPGRIGQQWLRDNEWFLE